MTSPQPKPPVDDGYARALGVAMLTRDRMLAASRAKPRSLTLKWEADGAARVVDAIVEEAE